jgi:hypothetical protein
LKKIAPTIPDEFLPPAAVAKLGGARERRGSAAGSVIESLRVASREEYASILAEAGGANAAQGSSS